jgi:transcriptional regulator GlxA family with amidase domain
MQVARLNLIDWHHVGQQPFARLASTRQQQDATIAEVQAWAGERFHLSNPVQAMIKLSGLPERTFKRRFQQATGMAPLAYIHALRIEQAKNLLETGLLSIDAIAADIGYEDAGYFSRLFRRLVGLTPVHYRRRFSAVRQALAGTDA